MALYDDIAVHLTESEELAGRALNLLTDDADARAQALVLATLSAAAASRAVACAVESR